MDGSNPWDVQIDGSLVAYANFFPPSSMAYTPRGMSGAPEVYITYRNADDPNNPINPDPQPAKWLVKPGLDVEGDLNVSGDTHLTGSLEVDGATQLNADLSVDGNIGATGNISMDGNLAIGGVIDGDLTVNGSITIDGGGSIIDGNSQIEEGTVDGEIALWDAGNKKWAGEGGSDPLKYDSTGIHNKFMVWDGQQSQFYYERGPDGAGLRFELGKIAPLGNGDGSKQDDQIDLGETGCRFKDAYFSGAVDAGSFVKSGGTSAQLLCADGSVVDKGTVGGSTDLSDYYTKTESDGKYEPKIATKNSAFNKNFGTASGTVAQGNHNHDGTYAKVGDSYTKAESDSKYEVKGGGGGGLPAGDWHCTGSITAVGNITAYSSSDERLKDDIVPMPVGLIDAIKPVQFKWKDGGKSSAGVIAQQLQEVGLDDYVNEAPNGDLGVDYNALIGVLLAEVIDLKRRIAK